ncbi:MAG: hypothetical protein ACJ8GJ_20540 [Vitreoscilla sp.]
MPRPSRPDKPAASAGAAPPWAADEAHAESTAPAGVGETAQMPLFNAAGPAAPRLRKARLRSRIKALLSARLKRRTEPAPIDDAGSSDSSWPDSFFDVRPGP